MSRYRLAPTPEQEVALLDHCAHARYVWNLALEQWSMWRRGRRTSPPRFAQQCVQLTEARADNPWLADGSCMVQQQALRDFDQAVKNYFSGALGKPTWRKAGKREGFRIVGQWVQRVEKVNRKWAQVMVPKVGWVKFRLSRPLADAKSFRVTRDRAGRWHIAFAVIPDPIAGPGTSEVVGVDRGVAVSAALSTGELLKVPKLTTGERVRLRRLQQRLARAQVGSNRRDKTKVALARLIARDADRRKNWIEQVSTDLARRFDVIRVEDLNIRNMTKSARGTIDAPGVGVRQKAGLNRGILASGWGGLVRRLEQKAPGRVERIDPAYTSLTCSCCGAMDRRARESQAVFRCRSCGYTVNADVNAAVNIAAGWAVRARGATAVLVAENREPQLPTSA